MKAILNKVWLWVKPRLQQFTNTLWAITIVLAKLAFIPIAATVIFATCVILYPVALTLAAAYETNNQKDLALNDRNEIIEGSVDLNQHPLRVYKRPQPTWMN